MKNSKGDTLRVHLDKFRDVVGLRSTRCQRKYNQDRYKVLVLNAPQLETDAAATGTTTSTPTANQTSSNTISQVDADQKTLFYFAIFDGHGGSNTADYLTANLDEYIEAAKPNMVPKVIKDLRKLGGYFRNFRPHFLEPFLPADFEKKGSKDAADRKEKQKQAAEAAAPTPIPTTMTLEQRLCLSFLQCDAELIRDKYQDGSTASVVIVQSKGAFWETPDDLDLILAHVGDTRILLCEAPRGESIQLTTDHHPDAVVEADRIRRMAAYVSADSFGENMFLGQLANTRALGDIAMKPFGVSAEPELIRRTVKASEAAFLVLMSDGISSVMSNQEVVDCVKLEESPTQAAANVLNLAEQLGAEDNCTVMIVKLPAWGAKMPDLSKELREYRWQSEAQQSRARRR
ncbi:MAG: phosphatase 2C-like domain-containing protein [Linnemannia gamsii]|nr:MAG: phosphatase 2C-like domain-containing protein [Linnemannia gamsii]